MLARIVALLGAAAAGAAGPTVSWNFEGGSLERAERVSADHFRAFVRGQTDQDGRNRQASWYYFRVDGATPGREITIDITGLPGEYNYAPNRGAITADTPPVISVDRTSWRHIEQFSYDSTEPHLRLEVPAPAATFFIAHTPPYVGADLERLRTLVRASGREQVIGKSVDGRPLLLWTIEQGSPGRTVWLMFRQHAWESGSSWAGEGTVRELLKDPRNIRWKILPLADPDGVAHGGVRFNRNGYDLNRNWDSFDSRRMPEIYAQHAAIADWIKAGNKVDLLLSIHNTETSEYLEAASTHIRPLAERFFASLEKNTAFAPSRPLVFGAETTTPGKPGRMTVIQGLWNDFGVPGFLMEQRIAFNQRLGRRPLVSDRLEFGHQLVNAIANALRDQN